MSDDPIARLITNCAAGDRAAFRRLYRDRSGKLTGLLLRMLKDRGKAAQTLQKVFARIWLRAGRFELKNGRGMTSLIAIARNLAIDRLRARPAPENIGWPDLVPQSGARAAPRPAAKLGARRIADCLGRLGTDHAAAVRGACLDGLSCGELSVRFAVSLTTMQTWLWRSLRKLKECLES